MCISDSDICARVISISGRDLFVKHLQRKGGMYVEYGLIFEAKRFAVGIFYLRLATF